MAVVTPEQFLERLAAVRIDRSHGGRAPHKPLMLLLALGRVRLGPKSRLYYPRPSRPSDYLPNASAAEGAQFQSEGFSALRVSSVMPFAYPITSPPN